MMDKVIADVGCKVSIAMHWSVAAKNSLANVYGFSPNMLVFGRNISFPSGMNNKPPANSQSALNKYVAEMLNAIQCARLEFVRQEAREKLRRAFNRKTRTYSDITYHSGDMVYFKRNNAKCWHGPAKVIGKDGKQVLLKQGGLYVRVHPCRLQHCHSLESDYGNENMNDVPKISRSDVEPRLQEMEVVRIDRSGSSNIDIDQSADEVIDTNDGRSQDIENAVNDGELHSNVDGVMDNPTSDNSQTPAEMQGTSTVTSSMPKIGSSIKYKTESSDWQSAKIVSRGGKAKGKYWHFLNVQNENDDEPKSLSFRDEVTDWSYKDAEETQFVECFLGASTNKARFDKPKMEELAKWRRLQVYNEVTDVGQKAISCRWVCTDKIKEGHIVSKARLVARGYEEDKSKLQTASPTSHKESLRIALCILISMSWKLCCLDVKCAFLQGEQLNRSVILRPPSIAKTDKLWELNKPVYGLSDASMRFYKRLKCELEKLGMKVSSVDPALFYYKKDGVLHGIAVVHVDDILYGGSQQFTLDVISILRTVFELSSDETDLMNIKYLGLDISCFENKITVSLTNYIAGIEDLSSERSLPADKERSLSPEELKQLRQFCGQVNWAITQCRPDAAFDNCVISNNLKKGTYADLTRGRKLLKKLKQDELSLSYVFIDKFNTCKIVIFADASFGNLISGGSQGGYLIFLVAENGQNCLIAWQSKRIRRVVKSTLAAECLTAVEAAEHGFTLQLIVDELQGFKPEMFILSDNKSLVDTVCAIKNIEDKRLRIDVNILREMIDRKEITRFQWVESSTQIADCLTKQGSPTYRLQEILNKSLRFDFISNTFKEW